MCSKGSDSPSDWSDSDDKSDTSWDDNSDDNGWDTESDDDYWYSAAHEYIQACVDAGHSEEDCKTWYFE